MRVLVTGAAGMLGRDLVEILSEQHDVIGAGRRGPHHCVDITDARRSTLSWKPFGPMPSSTAPRTRTWMGASATRTGPTA